MHGRHSSGPVALRSGALLRELAARCPEREALIDGSGRRLSYSGLAAAVAGLGHWLLSRGVLPGHRVALLFPDGMDLAVVALACMDAATCVPLNPSLAGTELERQLGAMDARLLLAHPSLAERALGLGRRLGLATGVVSGEAPCQAVQGLADLAPGPAPANVPALVLQTSGSTGTPKRVPLSQHNVLSSASNIIAALGLTECDRCLNMMPMFHVGGLIDLLLAPLASGGTVICGGSYSAPQWLGLLRGTGPTWWQAVPTVLGDAIAHADAEGVPLHGRLRFVRAVSSALPAGLAARAEAAFGAPLVEIYGMSEAAGQITASPLPPARRPQGSVGRPLGTEIMVLDAFGNRAPAGGTGEILVRGPSVMGGYEAETGQHADVFHEDWFRTGDLGYLDEEGFLFLTGRAREMINRGGEKIAPGEVDDAVLRSGLVREAAAFGLPHPTLGEIVALAVVPAAHWDEQELRRHLETELADFKRPARIFEIEALPRTAGGKLQRTRLRDRFAGPEAAAPLRPPRTETERSIERIWRRLLGRERISVDDNFFDLGGDSLKAAEFMHLMEAEHGLRLPPSRLYDLPTIASLARELAQAVPASPARAEAADEGLPAEVMRGLQVFMAGWRGERRRPDSLLVGHNTGGSRVPLFWCVNAYEEFASLSRHLGQGQPVYGMRSLYQVPGRTPELNRPLSERFLDEMLALHPQGPFLLGGYCEGGRIAMQLAGLLKNRGRQVALLVLHEHFEPRDYDGRVAMFACTQESQSWARYFVEPARGWRKFYGDSLILHRLAHRHLDAYREPWVEQFARLLEEEMRQALTGAEVIRRCTAGPLEPAARLAELGGRVPRLVTAGREFRVPVRVRNIGTATWEPTHRGGILLACRWRNRRGRPRGPLAGWVPLEHPLRPGFSFATELPVAAPGHGCFRYLDVDVVEDGLCWFQDNGSTPLRQGVLVMPPLTSRKTRLREDQDAF